MSIFNTTREDLEKGSSKHYTPTDGLHQAVVVAIIDLGEQEKENDRGEKYMSHGIEFVFSIDELNDNSEHMTVKREMTLTYSDKSLLRKMTVDCKWDWKEVSDLLGKPCQVLTKIVKTKAGKDFPKLDTFMTGTGFKPTGKVLIPFWYKDVPSDNILLLPKVVIGEKHVREPDSVPPTTPAPSSDTAPIPDKDFDQAFDSAKSLTMDDVPF